MLTPTLRTILERAAGDAAFRESLLCDPDTALAAFALSADEAAMLRSLSAQQLAQLATDLSALDGELSEEMLEKVAAGQSGSGLIRRTASCQTDTCQPN
jgi:hypothetical protein